MPVCFHILAAIWLFCFVINFILVDFNHIYFKRIKTFNTFDLYIVLGLLFLIYPAISQARQWRQAEIWAEKTKEMDRKDKNLI